MITLRRLLGKKGQSITEYAIMVSIVIGALIAMQTYVRNSLSAKIKLAADGIHEGQEYLYQPKTTETKTVMIQRDGTSSQVMDQAGKTVEQTGAGTDVTESWSETKFQELQAEGAGE